MHCHGTRNVWTQSSSRIFGKEKGREKMMILLQVTISQKGSHPSDTVKGTRTHWGKSHLCTTLKEGGHESHWKKKKPSVILICIWLSNPLSCFTINSFVHTHKHPYTQICFIYTVVLGQLIKQLNAPFFFQSTQTRIMRYYILEKTF